MYVPGTYFVSWWGVGRIGGFVEYVWSRQQRVCCAAAVVVGLYFAFLYFIKESALGGGGGRVVCFLHESDALVLEQWFESIVKFGLIERDGSWHSYAFRNHSKLITKQHCEGGGCQQVLARTLQRYGKLSMMSGPEN